MTSFYVLRLFTPSRSARLAASHGQWHAHHAESFQIDFFSVPLNALSRCHMDHISNHAHTVPIRSLPSGIWYGNPELGIWARLPSPTQGPFSNLPL